MNVKLNLAIIAKITEATVLFFVMPIEKYANQYSKNIMKKMYGCLGLKKRTETREEPPSSGPLLSSRFKEEE